MENRDPRLDLYCVRSGSRTMGIQFSTDPADKTVYDYVSGTSVTNSDVTGNKSEYGPNGIQGPGGFLWRKFCDPAYYGSITGTDYEDELDVPVIRLAELLLIDAEANIEWEGGDLTRAQIPDRPGPRPGEDAAGGRFVPGGAPQRTPL